jgi:hypothetical protein
MLNERSQKKIHTTQFYSHKENTIYSDRKQMGIDLQRGRRERLQRSMNRAVGVDKVVE